ncbi:MAG: MlaD family protein, partial [Gemmatimonadaceae bacterium]
MARKTDWKDLRIGLTAFVGVVGVTLSILFFARVGALHGETTSIYVLTRSAPGVLNGTDVWLSGAKVGQVKDVHFRPASSDTLERVAIHLEILSDKMNYIRTDAYADIRPGGNLIGSPVVWISSGTSRAPALQEGDSLVDRPSTKMQPVGDRVTAIVTRLTALTDSGGRVISLLNSQIGTAGKIVGTGLPRVATAASSMSDILRRAGT